MRKGLVNLGCFALVWVIFIPCPAAERAQSEVYGWKQFTRLEAAQKEIDFRKVDTNLIAAAVFHATNAKRVEHGLKPLKYEKKAGLAAAIQSDIMRRRGSISHNNPETPRFNTLDDRARAAGLEYKLIAENVATAFGYAYESGRSFYARKEGGKEVFSYKPGGAPIRPHTYVSFAEALVKSWMESPGHRKNILLKDAEYLGASCLPEKRAEGMVRFYCTQVFFTPMK